MEKFSSFLKENKKVFEGKENLLVQYVQARTVYWKIEKEYNNKLDELESSALKEIKNKYKIKSCSYHWLNEKLKSEISAQQESLKKEKMAKLESALDNFPQPKFIMLSQLRFEEENPVEEILMEKNKKNQLSIPLQELTLCKKLSAPYEVIKEENKPRKNLFTDDYSQPESEVEANANSTFHYKLKKHEAIKVDSTKNFWRIRYLIKSYLTVTNNIFRCCWENAWNSSLGISALYKKELQLEDQINSETGEIIKATSSETYRGKIAKLVADIIKNRFEFEQRKSNGLFGKGVERIFNLTYNYVFKGLGEGFAIGVVYPVAILGCSTINFAVSLTSWVWAIGYIGVVYPFNLIVYDTLESYNENENKRKYNHYFKNGDDCHKNRSSYLFFPLPSVILINLGFGGVLHSSVSVLLALGQPAVSLAYSLFAGIRFALRSVYNSFMFRLLQFNGRIPQTNTRLAWIISGPGVSKNYYNHLSIEDSLVLVECEIEKLILENYRKEITERLNDPIRKYNHMKKLFDAFYLDFSSNSYKEQNCNDNDKSKNSSKFNSEGKYDFGIESSVKFYEKMLNKQINEKFLLILKQKK